MLRLIVLLLALANLLTLAWGRGWLQAYGLGPASPREPQRLAQQVHPEALALISEAQLAALQAAARPAAPPVCLQSGWFGAEQADALRGTLTGAWPPGSWTLDSQQRPERWIVYMGRYANAAELAKKREQLVQLHLRFEPLRDAALAPGLSLGAYPTQAQAEEALRQLGQRGVRTARVLLEQPALAQYRLRLPAVDEALRARLAPLQAQLPNQALTPCPAP